MLTAAVDSYLTARRALGYRLQDTEDILRDFASFASTKSDTMIASGIDPRAVASLRLDPTHTATPAHDAPPTPPSPREPTRPRLLELRDPATSDEGSAEEV